MEKPVILNGDFEQGSLGWSNTNVIEKEENGNHYIINNSSWIVRQDMDLLPHTTYQINADTKKGTATGPARIVFTFLDVNGGKLAQFYDIKHLHKSGEWEQIPKQFIVVPDGAAKTRIYLLTNDPKGYHCFDNIQITRAGDIGDRKELEANADKQELIVNGDFELGLYGWIGITSLIKEEENNRYIRNGYNWEVFQPLEVVPGQKYILKAKTRKVDSSRPARIKIVFFNQEGHRAPEFYNVLHYPQTGAWEEFSEVIQTPPDYHVARVYLLADDATGNGTCDFDNISLKPASEEELNSIKPSTEAKTQMIHSTQYEHTKYVVKSGDTASGIARQFGVNVQSLIDENNIANPNRLEVGQILYIPQ